jgi:hypothetical protein
MALLFSREAAATNGTWHQENSRQSLALAAVFLSFAL